MVDVPLMSWFGGGFLAVLLGQAGLFGGITFYRMRRKG
jgi:hypothetical protein